MMLIKWLNNYKYYKGNSLRDMKQTRKQFKILKAN